MRLKRLTLTHFRNLTQADFYPGPGINLLVGENGSGKTSILEAIYLLAMVRSFRSKRLKHLIQHQQSAFTVHGRLGNEQGDDLNIAVQRRLASDEVDVRLRGERPGTLAQLTAELPLQLINSDAFRLLEGGPKERRQFLDWGGFHTNVQFIGLWQRFQRALKQRNSLLRHAKIDALQLDVWDREMAAYGSQLTQLREEYLDSLTPLFSARLQELGLSQSISLSFQRGWDRQMPLYDHLQASRDKDKEQGFTQSGPQRADLRISVEGRAALDVLSRGQQKLVVSALKLAQGELLSRQAGKKCVYLIDDLPAELDSQHRRQFCALLEKQQAQVFISSVEADALADWISENNSPAWFHVKQGQLLPLSH